MKRLCSVENLRVVGRSRPRNGANAGEDRPSLADGLVGSVGTYLPGNYYSTVPPPTVAQSRLTSINGREHRILVQSNLHE